MAVLNLHEQMNLGVGNDLLARTCCYVAAAANRLSVTDKAGSQSVTGKVVYLLPNGRERLSRIAGAIR